MDATNFTTEKRQFHIRSCLGRGGFGEVYRATMMSAGGVRSDVAVKVLLQELDPRSQAVERLRDEARLLGVLNHPNILKVTDLVLLDQRVALVTEYVEGADLDQCIEAPEDAISLRALVETIGRVGDALHAAHTSAGTDGQPLKLVHRDIKPSNIRISKHGSVKLLDFGIAKATDSRREAKTQTNALIGSFLYMAPERFEEGDVTPAADVYALGLTLFEGIFGRPAFGDLNIKHQYGLAFDKARHDAAIEERLAKISPPEKVMALMRHMLRFEASERPTPAQLSAMCDDVAEELDGPSLRRWCKGHPWPEPQALEGPLDGKVITETAFTTSRSFDTLANTPPPALGRPATPDATTSTAAQPSPVAPEKPKRRSAGVILAVLAVGALLLGALLVVGVVGLVATQSSDVQPTDVSPTPTVKVKEDPKPEPEVAAAPAPEPVTAPEPVVEVKPKPDPKSKPDPKPKPTEAPVPEAPSPEPQPAAGAQTATVLVEGARATLRNGTGNHDPGALTPGTYELWADFGSGPSRAAVVKAIAGQTVTYRCSRLKQTCAKL